MPNPVTPLQLSLLLAAMTGIILFAIDAYLPAFDTMSKSFSVPLHQMELTVSSFLFGYALGSMVGGPLSDHMGRRRIGLMGLTLFCIASFGISLSYGYSSLLVLRFVQAIGGGFTVVIVPALVRDMFERQQAARILASISFIMLAPPLLAPVIGTLVLVFAHWPMIFVLLAIYSGGIILLGLRFLPHSREPTEQYSQFSIRSIARDFLQVLKHRQARPYLIAGICSQALFFIYITQSAFLFVEYLEFTVTQFPLIFCSFVVSFMVVNRINAYLLKHLDSRLLFVMGTRFMLLSTSIFLLLSLLDSNNKILVLLSVLMCVLPVGLIVSNGQANFLHFFAEKSGTANALLRTLQLTTGALLGAVVSSLYNGSLLPMSLVMCGIAVVAAKSAHKPGELWACNTEIP